MALQGGHRSPVSMADVFPFGCYAMSVEQAMDYDEKSGRRTPSKDKQTGELVWAVTRFGARDRASVQVPPYRGGVNSEPGGDLSGGPVRVPTSQASGSDGGVRPAAASRPASPGLLLGMAVSALLGATGYTLSALDYLTSGRTTRGVGSALLALVSLGFAVYCLLKRRRTLRRQQP